MPTKTLVPALHTRCPGQRARCLLDAAARLAWPHAPQGETNFHISPLLARLFPRLPVGWSIRTSSFLCPPGRD